MSFLDYFRVALKNLIRQKTRTVLTIVAITVGSLSLILMTSIIISIRQSLVDQFQKLGAFSLVSVVKDPNSTDSNSAMIGTYGDPTEGKLIDDAALSLLRAIPYVTEATPTLATMVKTIRLEDGTKKNWANITGFDPNNDVFGLDLAYGRKLTSADMDKIVVGSDFVQNMGYGGHPQDLVGKKVLLNTNYGGGSGPDWGTPPAQPPMNADKSWYEDQNKNGLDVSAEIVGIIKNGTIDNGQSYINIAWARKLAVQVSWQWQDSKQKNEPQCVPDPKTGKQNCTGGDPFPATMTLVKEDSFPKNGYNAVILKVDDQANITPVAEAVTKLGYGANTAKAMLDQINKMLYLIGLVLALVGGISLFVASIGIINTMIMATFERTREIGVMRACGATRGTIRKLFTFEAGLLGFWGGVFGIAISFGLGQIAHLIVNKFGASLGNIPVEKIGSFPWWLIVAVLVFTSALGMIAGLYPAIRASRMDPVDALRYE